MRHTAWALGALALATAVPLLAADDEEGFDRTPTNCVSTTRIRRTTILDDQTILFYLHGNRVYRNTLKRQCIGLERAQRFSYRVTSTRLCNVDTITVLEPLGVSFMPGATCRLGDFYPITKTEAEDLIAGPEGVTAKRNAIEVKEVKLPPDEDTADDAAAGAQPNPEDAAAGAQPSADDADATATAPDTDKPRKRRRRDRQ